MSVFFVSHENGPEIYFLTFFVQIDPWCKLNKLVTRSIAHKDEGHSRLFYKPRSDIKASFSWYLQRKNNWIVFYCFRIIINYAILFVPNPGQLVFIQRVKRLRACTCFKMRRKERRLFFCVKLMVLIALKTLFLNNASVLPAFVGFLAVLLLYIKMSAKSLRFSGLKIVFA